MQLTRTSRRKDISPRKVREMGELGSLETLGIPRWVKSSSHPFPGPSSQLFRQRGKRPAPPTPDAGGGAPGQPGGRGQGPVAGLPSSSVWNSGSAGVSFVPPLQPPTQAEGKGQYGRLHSSLKGEGPQDQVHRCFPGELQGAGPEEVGPGRDADFTPLPLGPLAVQGTPRPLQCCGRGRQPSSPEPCSRAGRGEARMGAWPLGRHPPRTTQRQQGPQRSRAHSGPEREEATRGTGDSRF